MTELLHRGHRNCFFFTSVHLLSIFYLDFYIPFLFGLLFPFNQLPAAEKGFKKRASLQTLGPSYFVGALFTSKTATVFVLMFISVDIGESLYVLTVLLSISFNYLPCKICLNMYLSLGSAYKTTFFIIFRNLTRSLGMTQRKRKFLILMMGFLRNHQSYKPERLVLMTLMSIMKWILIIKIAMIKLRT